MSLGLTFIIIFAIIIALLQANNHFNSKRFINEIEPYFKFLMEDDYAFLLRIRYGELTDEDVATLYNKRVRNGLVVIVLMMFLFMANMSFMYVLLAIIIGFVVFKTDYMKLKKYYTNNLTKINQTLPYYLKGLEILIQHYTVPVALARSVDTAPEIFRDGLRRMIQKIDEGDSSVQPYMDFANEYPVRDSMRMMRLLYRLSLGSNENKQEQLLMFSRSISTLQNKAREQKYQARLEKMEQKTMVMLFGTGGGILGFLLLSMMMVMSF